jgi:hypothetical protein
MYPVDPRIHPDTADRIRKLREGRARRLAILNQHAKQWPDTFTQLGPVMDEMRRQMIADGLPDPATIPGLTLPSKSRR